VTALEVGTLLGGDFDAYDVSWAAITAHLLQVAHWLADLRAPAKSLRLPPRSGATGHDLSDLADSTPPATDGWPAVARGCAARGATLNSRELDFIERMARRVVLPSERQLAWLRAIYAHLQSLYA
jgi:hypothetical protein